MCTSKHPLQFVNNQAELKENIAHFNAECRNFMARALPLIRQAEYWLYDEDNDVFGASKFVAYAQMNFNFYEEAVRGLSAGRVSVATQHGATSRKSSKRRSKLINTLL